MTAVVEERITEPAPDVSTMPISLPGRQGRRIPTLRVLAISLSLLVATSWLLSNFVLAVRYPVDNRQYAVPVSSLAWISTPSPSSHSFFRLPFDVSLLPQTTTLWYEADQNVVIYLNGERVLGSFPSIVADGFASISRQYEIQAVDLRPLLRIGANVLGFEVSDLDGRRSAVRASLVQTTGTYSNVLTTSSPGWRVTSDTSQARVPARRHGPSFSETGFNYATWATPTEVSGPGRTFGAAVPPWAMEVPLRGSVIASRAGGDDLLASTTVRLASSPTDGWIRVAASGPFTVLLNNQPINTPDQTHLPVSSPDTDGTAPSLPIATGLYLYDIGSLFHAGTNKVSVHVDASPLAEVSLDGSIDLQQGREVDLATGASWSVQDPNSNLASQQSEPSTIGVPDDVWRFVPFTPAVAGHALPALPASGLLHIVVPQNHIERPPSADAGRRTVFGYVIGGWLLAALLIVTMTKDADVASALATAGLLPAAGFILAVDQLRHVATVVPPFPDTPGIQRIYVVLLVLGLVLAVIAGWRLRSGPFHARQGRQPRLTHRQFRAGVCAIAAGMVAVLSYHLAWEPFWQDELYSLAAARGIRQHLLPRWPSGFLYFKSELFSAVIALVSAVVGDKAGPLRFVSVLCFGGAVIAFGLLLVPMVLPGRRWPQLLATAFFATAPAQLTEARDLRMYQMAQLLTIIFFVLLVRAVTEESTRAVVLSALALVALYFTHEESFCILPAAFVVILIGRGWRVMTDRRWLVPFGAAGALIALQVSASILTHPPSFGIDHSNGPIVKWTPDPWFYFNNVFSSSSGTRYTIAPVTALVFISLAVAIWKRDRLRIYLGAFLILGVATLSVALPDKQVRYAFILLPFLFALAAAGCADVCGALYRFVTRAGWTREIAVLLAVASITAATALPLAITTGPSDYGLLAARLTGSEITHHNIDFGQVVTWLRSQLQPGDVVIAVCPVNLVAQYLGRAPDYWLPYRRRDRLLFLFEKDGEAVDTEYGIPAILDGGDLERVMEENHRIWIVTDANAYLGGLLSDQKRIVELNFVPVEIGERASVYLRYG
jgi:hypothetical protein